MKKIMIIAYFFPPSGGGGVQRTSKFVKYLYRLGYKPIVVTANDEAYNLHDCSLLEDINKDINIYRIKKRKDLFIKLGTKKVNLNNLICIPDGTLFWHCKAGSVVKSLVKQYRIDMIYTTVGPYSTHLLGMFLKKSLKIKWIADFRDEWTTHPQYITNKLIYYNKLRVFIESWLERKVCEQADAIITISDKMTDNIMKKNKVDRSKFHVIPNGFDDEDFDEIKVDSIDNSIFTISYTGSFHGYCKPTNFLVALRHLIDEGKIDEGKIIVNFAGNHSEWIKQYVNDLELDGIVNICNYVDHKESIKILKKSDALLLIIPTAPNSDSIYTGKIFEYIRAQKPILALIPPDGIAADLLRRTKTGYICDNDNINEIQKNILDLYQLFYNSCMTHEFNNLEINVYSRENLTKELIKVINDI